MEAFSVLPVKAGHPAAKAQGASLGASSGPSGLGDVFATLLQQATLRLDTRPADLASFETRLTNGDPPRKVSAAESISSAHNDDRWDDAGFNAHRIDRDAGTPRDPIEPVAPAEDRVEIDDDSEFAVQGPEYVTETETGTDTAAADDDETHDPANGDIQFAEGEVAETEAPAPITQNDNVPAPEEIAAPAALPIQSQPVAASAALAATQALGAGEAAFAALARTATQSRVPAQAAPQAQTASTIVPAAAGQFGTEVGATRVQITPASVVAQPNAALGGGAAVAALAAESGQANAQNAAQNGLQNAGTSLPNAASQIAAGATTTGQNQFKPGNRGGSNGPAANNLAPAIDTATTTQGATTGPSGNGAANAAPIATTAPASGLPGQGQNAPAPGLSNPAAGEPGAPNPQNAQTAFSGPNNQNTGIPGSPGGLSMEAPASEAGAQNRLAQNARTDTAQSLGATAPGTGDPSIESGLTANASRSLADNSQGVRPAALKSNQNNTVQSNTAQNNTAQNATAQNARNETSTQPGVTARTATQNATTGTAAAAERAIAPSSIQRAEGAGPANANANANTPAAAGTPGLTQAALRTQQTLPAQARPAAAASLPANQVAVNIQRAVAAGQDRIRITLHPAELGQIDVKLSLSNDGAVKAIVSIERPETFELLQRDARGLEKALQDAGLKTDSGSLSFNLKGEEEQNTAASREDRETGSQDAESDTPDTAELTPEIIAAANANGAERALDLHV